MLREDVSDTTKPRSCCLHRPIMSCLPVPPTLRDIILFFLQSSPSWQTIPAQNDLLLEKICTNNRCINYRYSTYCTAFLGICVRQPPICRRKESDILKCVIQGYIFILGFLEIICIIAANLECVLYLMWSLICRTWQYPGQYFQICFLVFRQAKYDWNCLGIVIFQPKKIKIWYIHVNACLMSSFKGNILNTFQGHGAAVPHCFHNCEFTWLLITSSRTPKSLIWLRVLFH